MERRANDDRGRILDERAARADAGFTTMLIRVPVRYDSTLYQQWGDWFAWVDVLALAAIVVLWLIPRRAQARPLGGR